METIAIRDKRNAGYRKYMLAVRRIEMIQKKKIQDLNKELREGQNALDEKHRYAARLQKLRDDYEKARTKLEKERNIAQESLMKKFEMKVHSIRKEELELRAEQFQLFLDEQEAKK